RTLSVEQKSRLCKFQFFSSNNFLSTNNFNLRVLCRTTFFRRLLCDFRATMAGVMQKFLVASMFMWILPIAILYGFNNDLLPGSTTLSPHSLTLLSGFLAVVSVNVVIVFYICLALKEPADKHKPDALFVAEAKDSVKKFTSGVTSSDPALKKQE
ncbi:hypothetical protein EUTSA_v10017819mg, partial [Eutrema salsugineum]